MLAMRYYNVATNSLSAHYFDICLMKISVCLDKLAQYRVYIFQIEDGVLGFVRK